MLESKKEQEKFVIAHICCRWILEFGRYEKKIIVEDNWSSMLMGRTEG